MYKNRSLHKAANLFTNVASELDTAGESHLHWNPNGKESHVYFQLHPKSAEAFGFSGFEIDVLVNKGFATVLALLTTREHHTFPKLASRATIGERLISRGYEYWYKDNWLHLEQPRGSRQYVCFHERATPVDVPAHVELHRFPFENLLSHKVESLAKEVAINIQEFVCTLLTVRAFPSISQLREKWHDMTTSKTSYQRGRALEDFAETLFQFVPSFEVRSRVRSPGSEFDLVILNHSQNPFWSRFGPQIFVECKNWEKEITPAAVRDFAQKLSFRHANCGILLSRKGVSKGAKTIIGKNQMKGIFIIYLDESELELMCQSLNITGIIEQKFFELF